MEPTTTVFVTSSHIIYTDITSYLDSLDLFLQWEQDEILAEQDLNTQEKWDAEEVGGR
jgi:hypothetical protein